MDGIADGRFDYAFVNFGFQKLSNSIDALKGISIHISNSFLYSLMNPIDIQSVSVSRNSAER